LLAVVIVLVLLAFETSEAGYRKLDPSSSCTHDNKGKLGRALNWVLESLCDLECVQDLVPNNRGFFDVMAGIYNGDPAMREIKHHGLDLSIGRYSSGHSADLYHHRGFRHSRLRPPNLYPCSITETRSIDRQRSDGNWMGNAQLKADLSAACPNACISAAALQRPGFDSRREQRFRKKLNKL
jgi:hypothetical protein